jgi:site-specific recombinase
MKKIIEKIAQNPSNEFHDLIALVHQIRPHGFQKKESAIKQIKKLIDILRSDAHLQQGFKNYLLRLIAQHNPMRMLVDLGITPATGFFRELVKRISHKYLPPVPQTSNLGYVLEKTFHKRKDYKWVTYIPDDIWMELLQTLDLPLISQLEPTSHQVEAILNAILITSLRIGSIGLESEIIDRLPELEKLDSPFLAQNIEVDEFIAHFKQKDGFERTTENEDYKQVLILIKQCETYIDLIRKNKNQFGITLHITAVLLRLSQNILRLKTLLRLLLEEKEVMSYEKEVQFFKQLVRLENQKNNLREYVKNNINLLAFQITEHAGRTGEHYITTSRKEYWQMLFSALGGGFIVGFLVIFKTLIYYLKLPPFGTALSYSLNYSFGFIAIHLTKSTLATKQPAMTATRIAQSLDSPPQADKVDVKEKSLAFAELVAQTFRSQLIALWGNILMAFPIAYGVAWTATTYLNITIADAHKAETLLQECHPFQSYALFHAGIAGVFLFLSGLISGYYDNQCVSHQIPKRIKHHSFLRKVLPTSWLTRFTNYIDHNLGSLMGNFWFGIFLGSTSTIGLFLGLPLDIRHVTFSMGNFGLAMFTLDNQVSWQVISITLSGILAIGCINLVVSFSLALYVAIRSRNINFKHTRELVREDELSNSQPTSSSFRQGRELFGAVVIYFFRKPLHFIFPPRQQVAEKQSINLGKLN